ncbi:MAG: VOC family protein [Boseongicola sp.]|nr:VOC family protein [Boseongicola sp.]MDD9978598.1 VOC family protein [Boseongicola sp.]
MTYQAPAETRVGHIHLKVTDLERSIAFYRDVLGFDVKLRYGSQAAFLAAGDYHHHIGLNTWHSAGRDPVKRDAAGMYHVAFVYPDRKALGLAVGNAIDNGVNVYGAADHGVSEAVYFDDPDGNGIELYWDRDPSLWERDADENAQMINAPLDVAALVEEARAAS